MVKILTNKRYWTGELQTKRGSQEGFPMACQIHVSGVKGIKPL